MYFGSVKFFKHLIVGVPLLILLGSIGLNICFGIENGKKEEENIELRKQLILSGAVDAGDPSAQTLFEFYRESREKEEFLRLVSDYDSALYASFVKEDSLPTMNESGITAVPKDSGAPASADTSASGTSKTPGTTAPASSSLTTTPAATTTSAATTAASSATTSKPFVTTSYNGNSPVSGSATYTALYPDLYCDTTRDIVYNADMDYLYFTFDDGPSKYTENILMYLDKYGIKATFFVVPDGSAESNARLKKIADAGHTIGIHTATHEYKKIYESVDAYLEDFKIAYDRVYEATGIKCELFRFPGGSINDFNEKWREEIIAEMTRRGFIYFDWNVDSGDAAGATWTEMYTGVLDQIEGKNRAVILMHDHGNGYNTVLVLEDLIKALLNDDRGFKLDRLTKNVKPIQF